MAVPIFSGHSLVSEKLAPVRTKSIDAGLMTRQVRNVRVVGFDALGISNAFATLKLSGARNPIAH